MDHDHYEEVRRLEEHAYFEQQAYCEQQRQVAEELYQRQVRWQREQAHPPPAAPEPDRFARPPEWDQAPAAAQPHWSEQAGSYGETRRRAQWPVQTQRFEQPREAPVPRPDDQELMRQQQWVAARRRQLRPAARSAEREPEDAEPHDEPEHDLPALRGSDEPEHPAAELGLRYS